MRDAMRPRPPFRQARSRAMWQVMTDQPKTDRDPLAPPAPPLPSPEPTPDAPEVGGAAGPEPTRYGDWEKNGIAWDF